MLITYYILFFASRCLPSARIICFRVPGWTKFIFGGQLGFYSVYRYFLWHYRVKREFLLSQTKVIVEYSILTLILFSSQLLEVFDAAPNGTIDRMNSIVKSAVNVCTALYISVGFFGYIGYYKQSFSGNISIDGYKNFFLEKHVQYMFSCRSGNR